MQAYIGFDDTDTITADRGTGKLARWFLDKLPSGCRAWGVIRHQLLVHADIPYTSHNSSACVVVDIADPDILDELIARAAAHIAEHFLEGSDPGLCVALHGHPGLARLMAFGQSCTRHVVTQKDSLAATDGIHLSGHGGTNDGIIGAAAAVGLTAYGWSGRFIEYGGLRQIPAQVAVEALVRHGITPVPLAADAPLPAPHDLVLSEGWLRPRLWGGRAVLPIVRQSSNTWVCVDRKHKSRGKEQCDGR